VAHRSSYAVHRTLQPGGTSRFSLRPFDPTSLLDRHDVVGSRLAKTLEIELFDEPGQRQFPGFLLVVIDLAQSSPGSIQALGPSVPGCETNDGAFAHRSILAFADLF
jgi:hypothetical protein